MTYKVTDNQYVGYPRDSWASCFSSSTVNSRQLNV